MRKLLVAALIFGWAQAGPAPAETPRTPSVGVVDMERVFAESLLGKGYAAQIEKLQNEIKAQGTKRQAELQKLEAQLQALQDDLQRQQQALSEEAVERKQQELVAKQRERDALREDAQREIERMQTRAQQRAQVLTNEFQNKVRPLVEAASKERGLDILIDSRVMLFSSAEHDITRDVIIRADDLERAGTPAASGDKPAGQTPTKNP